MIFFVDLLIFVGLIKLLLLSFLKLLFDVNFDFLNLRFFFERFQRYLKIHIKKREKKVIIVLIQVF